MTKVFFARPRHEYASYTDFWELVRLSDYEYVWQDEIDTQSDNTYIVVGPDATLEFPNAKARIIYWLLEWYGDYYQRTGVRETWASNMTFADRVNAFFVPVGSHAQLGTTNKLDTIYDLCHMSYDGIYRRRLVLDALKAKGVSIGPNGWGKKREITLRQSRCMLHIHQHTDYPAIAPLRIALAAAYGLPFITESAWNHYPYKSIRTIDYNDLTDASHYSYGINKSFFDNAGDELHSQLCYELTFKRCVEAAL